jgi:hypothetical protein
VPYDLIKTDLTGINGFGYGLVLSGSKAAFLSGVDFKVKLYEWDGDGWVSFAAMDDALWLFGAENKVSLALGGNLLAVGRDDVGANGEVRLYDSSSASLNLIATVPAPVTTGRTQFGIAVALSEDGLVLLSTDRRDSSGSFSAQLYIFTRANTASSFSYQGVMSAPGTSFGNHFEGLSLDSDGSRFVGKVRNNVCLFYASGTPGSYGAMSSYCSNEFYDDGDLPTISTDGSKLLITGSCASYTPEYAARLYQSSFGLWSTTATDTFSTGFSSSMFAASISRDGGFIVRAIYQSGDLNLLTYGDEPPTGSGGPPPPAFWTDFQRTYEIP